MCDATTKGRLLKITLPKTAYLMLFKVMDEVGQELQSEHFDPDAVNNQLTAAAYGSNLETIIEIEVTLSIADWAQIYSLCGMVDVPSLRGQEFINDLRGYVEGALKRAGSG